MTVVGLELGKMSHAFAIFNPIPKRRTFQAESNGTLANRHRPDQVEGIFHVARVLVYTALVNIRKELKSDDKNN